MKKFLSSMLVLAAVGWGGCISHDETVVRDVARAKVEFENDLAARVFYETLSKHPNTGTRTESTTRVEIPVVLDHKQRVVTGPNAAFNEAVAACDTNRDGRITEMEARIFAEQRQPKK
jgi:hypothetical protein